MSKKAKLKTYRIEFKGTDLVLEDVRLVNIPVSNATLPYTRIEKHHSGAWMLVHRADGLFQEIPDEGININISRQGENRFLYIEDDECSGIVRRITKATRVNIGPEVFHLDCIERHTNLRSDWRLTHSPSFIAETPAIKSIMIKPMGM